MSIKTFGDTELNNIYTYNNINNNKMEDKENLIVEQQELKEKLSKLIEFINSEEYYKLSPNNRLVLKNQKIAMDLYLQVLNMRVFENVDEIYIPDYAFMQVFGAAFGNNWRFGDTNSIKYLRELVDKSDKKEEQ